MTFDKVDQIASGLDKIPEMVDEMVENIVYAFHWFYVYRALGVIVSESPVPPYKVDMGKLSHFTSRVSLEDRMRYYNDTGILLE